MVARRSGFIFITLYLGFMMIIQMNPSYHEDFIKWKYFPRYWPSVRGIHRSPVNSPHKGLWRGALMFSLIGAWINGWETGDLRRHRAHYDVTEMFMSDMDSLTASSGYTVYEFGVAFVVVVKTMVVYHIVYSELPTCVISYLYSFCFILVIMYWSESPLKQYR